MLVSGTLNSTAATQFTIEVFSSPASENASNRSGKTFLGAFTTFSTFGYETQTLLRTDRAATAAAYVGASVIAGVAAAALGYAAGRSIAT